MYLDDRLIYLGGAFSGKDYLPLALLSLSFQDEKKKVQMYEYYTKMLYNNFEE